MGAVVVVAAVVVALLALASGGDDGPQGLGGGEQLSGQAEVNRLLANVPQEGIAIGATSAPARCGWSCAS